MVTVKQKKIKKRKKKIPKPTTKPTRKPSPQANPNKKNSYSLRDLKSMNWQTLLCKILPDEQN